MNNHPKLDEVLPPSFSLTLSPNHKVGIQPPPAPQYARLVVVENIYYQVPGEQPVSVSTSYTRMLDTPYTVDSSPEFQPYARDLRISDCWTQLDIGWMRDKGASLLVLSNEEGKYLSAIPTEEEKRSLKKRVVHIMFGSGRVPQNLLLLLPGESIRITPWSLEPIVVRCYEGSAKCRLWVFPK